MAPRALLLQKHCRSGLQGNGPQSGDAEPPPRPSRATATRRLQPRLQRENLPLRPQIPAPQDGSIPGCTASAAGAQHNLGLGTRRFLVPQAPSPSPSSRRVQPPLTCLPKGSEATLPPPLSRTLVSGAHGGRGGNPEAALPLTLPPACRPRPLHGTWRASWSAPAAVADVRQARSWPMRCPKGWRARPHPRMAGGGGG